MARPPKIEKLRHGRLLCGSVFRFFVETWNWLTAYVDNMKGDAETDPQSGYITIDRANPDHPVIRFRADKVAAAGNPDDFPDPFTVRWAQSENNGQGAWVIWLCNQAGTFLVTVGRSRKTISDGITAAQTLPAGWYTMDDVSASGNQVWLNALVPKGGSTAPESVEISNRGKTDTSQRKAYSILVAQMSTDSSTGARRVRQYVTSAVIFGDDDEGGDVTLDEVSVDKNDSDELQIKDWDTGTPASSTTIAQDINSPPSNPSALVERDYNGALKYKELGTLAQLLGSTVTFSGKTILTGWNWDTTTHEIKISTAVISAANGVITSWTDQPVQTIPTTPISSILGS